MKLRSMAYGASVSLALFAAVAVAIAGPLDPPPGPVSPTYKTLNQVEPRTDVATLPGDVGALHIIDQPGSYYLSGNIQNPSAIVMLDVRSNDVTLDLNGFLIYAPTGTCVRIKSGQQRVTVRNGTMNSLGNALDAGGAVQVRVQLLNLVNVHHGIVVGPRASVEDCSVDSASVSGERITVGANSLVTRCRVWSWGASFGSSCFTLGDLSRASECTADGGSVGFTLGTAASLTDCSASNGGARGISASTNASIAGCTIQSTPNGIVMDAANRVERCKIGNVNVAIQCNVANTIVNNTVNAAAVNAGTGISLLSETNRVEGNDIYAFGVGVSVAGGRNIVVHNVFQQVGLAASGVGVAQSIVPVASNTSELAANAQANLWQ